MHDLANFFSNSTSIIMVFGKLKFTGSFTNNMANLSDLDQVKKRRRRGGAFLSTTGSFTLSSGGNGMGNS